MSIFQSFRSTVNGWVRGERASEFNVLADPITGSPVGLQHKNGSGPHGIWAPVDLTAAEIASPTAEMIADLNAVYRLNVAPWTRYYSNGTTLVATVASSSDVPITLDKLTVNTAVGIGVTAATTYLDIKGANALPSTVLFLVRSSTQNILEITADGLITAPSLNPGGFGTLILYAPVTITAANPMVVVGRVVVRNLPA